MAEQSSRLAEEQPTLTRSETVTLDVGPPPAYDGDDSTDHVPSTFCPPSYNEVNKLPSYDEAEKLKANEAGVSIDPPCPDRVARQNRQTRRGGFFFWASPGLLLDSRRRNVDAADVSREQLEQQVLGTDIEFLCCFLITFLFNWIGLFAALCCLTVTISGRAGSISGFGLSVIKWALLVMHQTYITRETLGLTGFPSVGTTSDSLTFLAADTENSGLTNSSWFTVSCWIIVALGFICFLQGIVHYARAKRCARDISWLRQRYSSQNF